MLRRLDSKQKDFAAIFKAFLKEERGANSDVSQTVAAIIADIRKRGDTALFELTARFEQFDAQKEGLRVSCQTAQSAFEGLDDDVKQSLIVAHDRITAFHQNQAPQGRDWQDADGNRLGEFWTPLENVGLYVPGGTASYPSSVLMNAVPARVAGVERLVMVVPSFKGQVNPLVLAAAHISGVHEIYKIGGAQAIAALAYGTASLKPVAKIVGPGNAYVAEAKRQVFGRVGIDMIAGPSEICVIADGHAPAKHIAIDLLSQAEHDIYAQAVLICPDRAYIEAVIGHVEEALDRLARADIARQSWHNYGCVIKTDDLSEAVALANDYASEHLELAVENPEALLPSVKHAGAVFLGAYSPEAIGDYIAGPNHVLPTNRSARFSSGLSVYDFLKRTSLIGCSPDGFAKIAPHAIRLAEAEGLEAHALSMALRLKNSKG